MKGNKLKKITKAVFPVAGLGTRFLPATKASPKEMLPVVDKPLIQYAVEEAAAAGITDMIFVTGRGKRTIEDHFDKAYELEAELELKGKNQLLEEIRALLPSNLSYVYIRQGEAKGLGHAVLCAKQLVGDEPFAVILADDLIDGEPPVMKQMVTQFEEFHSSILGVQRIERKNTDQYGIVVSESFGDKLERLSGIVEKPHPDEAPSTLAVVGRYILKPRIFHYLENINTGAGGELQLTDAIASLLQEERVLSYEFNGTRYDCGNKLGYLQATIAYGMKHHEIGKEFSEYLKTVTQ
jgi:UTP--glucose-1-phosphate uridylyltransferase